MIMGAILLAMAMMAAGCSLEQNNSQELEALRNENQQLKAQVASLEEERDSLQQQLQGQGEVSMQPNPGWEEYFSHGEDSPLVGESVAEIREILGNPPMLIRSISTDNPDYNREIWVFMVQKEDSTSLYLWFKGDELWDWRLDDFLGLYGSDLLQNEEFWVE